MKNFKSTLQNAEEYFETSTNDMENIFMERVNSEARGQRNNRNTVSFPLNKRNVNKDFKRDRTTLSDRLNIARPTPLVVLSNAGSIMQAEKYRNTFPQEPRWKTRSDSVEEVPFVDDRLSSFDIFSPTGNEARTILRDNNKKKMENENPPNLLKISSTNTEKKTIKKKSNFCILL